MRKKIKSIMSFAIALMMLFGSAGFVNTSNAVAVSTPAIKVLEVQPGTSFELPSILTSSKGYQVETMTIKRFIADKRELNGLYDIVYIGNNNGTYNTGTKYNSTTNKLSLAGTVKNEYYSANDITQLKSADLLNFLNSGQMVMFDSTLFTNPTSAFQKTNLYTVFNSRIASANVYQVGTIKESNVKSFYNNNPVKKPTLTVTSQPVSYNPSEANGGYSTSKYMSFSADVQSLHRMNLKLYIDVNGDSIYSASEQVAALPNIQNGEDYAINYSVPENFAGLQPWKLVLEDITTGAKNYVTGATAFKSNIAREISVLQITPSGNLFNVDTLGTGMLETDVYKIAITRKTLDEINNNPGLMDDNYDMIIIGFADSYGGRDQNFVPAALDKLEAFINQNRSVMFTHDTMAFWEADSPLTQRFRNRVGQDIYPDDAKYGWSDPTLTRTYNNSMPTYTNAYKINDGILSQYPYVLGDLNAVSNTHAQYFQLDMENPDIVTYYSLLGDDPRNQFYMYSIGNITYSGTGHASPGSSYLEKQLFVNTMVKALRGANNLPTVDVYGIVNGQNIVTSQDKLEFTFRISDIDEPSGGSIKAKIYIDEDNDGVFETTKTQSLTVKNNEVASASINLQNAGQRFNIRVEGIDKKGATSYVDVRLTHDDNPSVKLTVTKKAGYLVGDTDNLIYKLSPVMTSLNKSYMNLSIDSTATPTEGVPFKPTSPWSAVVSGKTSAAVGTLNFTPEPSWTDNTINLPVSFTKAGEYSVANQLHYTAGSETLAMAPSGDANYKLNVKEGHIGVDVKNNGKAVKDAKVLITYSNGSPAPYTDESGNVISTGEAITGSTGHVTFGKLPSGTYKISVDKSGYGIQTSGYGTPASVELSYDNPTVNLEYGPSTQLLVTTALTDMKDLTATKAVVGSNLNLKFSFQIPRDTATLKLFFDKNGLPGTFKEIKLGDIPLTMDANGMVQLPNNLDSGTYTLTMVVVPAIGAERFEPFRLSFTEYAFTERDVVGAQEIQLPMPDNFFNLTLVRRPRIE